MQMPPHISKSSHETYGENDRSVHHLPFLTLPIFAIILIILTMRNLAISISTHGHWNLLVRCAIAVTNCSDDLPTFTIMPTGWHSYLHFRHMLHIRIYIIAVAIVFYRAIFVYAIRCVIYSGICSLESMHRVVIAVVFCCYCLCDVASQFAF